MAESDEQIESQIETDYKKLLEDAGYYMSIGRHGEVLKLLIIALHLVTGAYTDRKVSVTFQKLSPQEQAAYGSVVATLVNEALPA